MSDGPENAAELPPPVRAMAPERPPDRRGARDGPWWAALAFVLGAAGLIIGAGLGMVAAFTPALGTRGPRDEAIATGLTLFGVGLLGVPLSWHALRHLLGRETLAWQASPKRWIGAGGATVVLALLCGQAALSLQWFVAPVLALAQGAMLFGTAVSLLALVAGSWSGFSRLHAWAQVVSGAWLATVFSLLFEVLLFGMLALMAFAALAAARPDEAQSLLETLQRFREAPNIDLLVPWVLKPWAIPLAFVALSFLGPAIEEFFKPLGVIVLLGKRATPMSAFLGGTLAGLGFAAVESFVYLSGSHELWLVAALTRIGTLVLHGFSAGLVGWGWGQAAATRRPGWLAAAYAGAVALHGLWNGAVLLVVFGGMAMYQLQPESAGAALVFPASSALLGVLLTGTMLVGCFVGMGLWGHRLRSAEGPPAG